MVKKVDSLELVVKSWIVLAILMLNAKRNVAYYLYGIAKTTNSYLFPDGKSYVLMVKSLAFNCKVLCFNNQVFIIETAQTHKQTHPRRICPQFCLFAERGDSTSAETCWGYLDRL